MYGCNTIYFNDTIQYVYSNNSRGFAAILNVKMAAVNYYV